MSGRNPAFEWRDQFSRAGHRGAVLAVGTWLGNHWNGDHKHPLAPVELLMEETGYSRRSVTLALATLRKHGWIAQAARGGRRGTTAWASRYRLTVPVTEDPNVQSAASQCATHCTPVDQTGVDQTTPPSRSLVDQPKRSGAMESSTDQERRARMKWASCPDFTNKYSTCPSCHVNDGCVPAMIRAGSLVGTTNQEDL